MADRNESTRAAGRASPGPVRRAPRGSRQRQGTRWAPGARVLAGAARALAEVVAHGRSADAALAPFEHDADRAAVRAVTLGSLRWYLRLLPALRALTGRKPRPLARELEALLVAAAHQVEYSRNVPEATVNAAVDAARILGQPAASGLVNAVLRRLVRERAALFGGIDLDRAAATAHPEWLVRELESAWPHLARAVLDANDEHPPLTLRVDRSRIAVGAYLEELARAGCPGRPSAFAPAAVVLEQARPVETIPGFLDGRVSLQDAAAQLAAPLLDARPGMRVLDACAAPGGKTVHLLEHTPGLADLLAVDIDPARLERIAENLARCHRTARLAVLDVRSLRAGTGCASAPLGGAPFERVLVDAPCSSTGVIRRHPDIKLLRRPADIRSFATLQLEILVGAFEVLAPGGRLLYCTCSVLPAENEQLVGAFLEGEPRARCAPMPPARELAPGALDRPVGVQLLPGGEAGTDGFYFACLEKTTAGNSYP
ncbi:MAG TPA: 16S rRNA (cytosine(967)-C(5))-methyltransferase RsmB [Steroidobacteraceae bacterium]|nr:16S rRNA (cytosine(967)-C(5))-methyltransferase RsmB [Steroidobacteraceae bacterium]